jgi:hypothetical protein
MKKRISFAAIFFASAAAVFAAEKPSLVVVISVDQMRNDYLDRFRPWFARDGFNRFLQRGARFPEARHRHAATFTCPGHAAIGSGLDPRETGVVGNYWLDRGKGIREYCVEDRAVQWVGAPQNAAPITALPASPVLLSGGFLGDRLKEKFPAARVVSLSLKDRAAVPMGGHKADAAVWFERTTWGRFVTSTYYPPRPSLLDFNEKLPAFFASHARWDISGRIPEKDLARATFDPPELARFKGTLAGTGERFPHALPSPAAVVESPIGDQLMLDFARYAIRDFRLGRNPANAPDLLFLGLSSLDYYGHRGGPDSREVSDGIVRLDRQLESFFQWLDSEVGSGRILLFLTADHGLTPIPEVSREKRRATRPNDPELGGRVDFGNGVGSSATVREQSPDRLALEKHLAATFAYSFDPSLPNALEGTVLRFEDPIGFYLNRPVIARRRLPP